MNDPLSIEADDNPSDAHIQAEEALDRRGYEMIPDSVEDALFWEKEAAWPPE